MNQRAWRLYRRQRLYRRLCRWLWQWPHGAGIAAACDCILARGDTLAAWQLRGRSLRYRLQVARVAYRHAVQLQRGEVAPGEPRYEGDF